MVRIFLLSIRIPPQHYWWLGNDIIRQQKPHALVSQLHEMASRGGGAAFRGETDANVALR